MRVSTKPFEKGLAPVALEQMDYIDPQVAVVAQTSSQVRVRLYQG